MNFFKSLFHPTIVSSSEQTSRLSKGESDAIKKSMQKGRAAEGQAINNSALPVQSSQMTIGDADSELDRKRMLKAASHNVIFQAIIRTRQAQLARFCRPARYSIDNVGFKVIPEGNDKHKDASNLSPQKQHKIKNLEDFIFNTGNYDANHKHQPQRQTFPLFINELIRNKIVYDQVNMERVFTKDDLGNETDTLDHFNIVDASTVLYSKTPKNMDAKQEYKQITAFNRTHPTKFNAKHMAFVVCHHGGTDTHGYGYSDVEAALNESEFEETTEDFNARYFMQGGTTRGILLINSNDDVQASAAAMKNLRQQWQSTAQGLTGAWKIPVISANDAKFVNMTQSSKDMEFERWLNYLINIICSVCKIQPDEINFPNRGGGATSKAASSSINEGSTQKAKMKQSRDKGLKPLMMFIEDFVNEEIMDYIAPKYRFVFTLGDDKTEIEHQQIMKLKEGNGMTINEYRKSENLDPLDTFNHAYDKIPGPQAAVTQALQVVLAQQATQNKANQASSDVRNGSKPTHTNTMINTDSDQQDSSSNGNQDTVRQPPKPVNNDSDT